MPNGAIVVRRAYLRENVDEKKQTEILRLVSMPGQMTAGLPSQLGIRLLGSIKLELNPQIKNSANKIAQIEARLLEMENASEDMMRRAAETNAKTILASISAVPADASADAFWNWWPSFNEEATSYKGTTYEQITDTSSNVAITGLTIVPHNCLIAGTPIQAIDGPKPVEQFEVGDYVVSMDQESGEITSRPVVYTSVRTADATFVIKLDSAEEIRATGGHNWWVTGHGWKRRRELTAGDLIRTADASIAIVSVKKIEEPIKVYNLFVDQTHTYFAGKARLLSWDVSSLQPTLQTVPGQRPAN